MIIIRTIQILTCDNIIFIILNLGAKFGFIQRI